VDYVMWKELRSNEEAKTHAFRSDLVCQYINGVSKMPGKT